MSTNYATIKSLKSVTVRRYQDGEDWEVVIEQTDGYTGGLRYNTRKDAIDAARAIGDGSLTQY